jgi:ubiquinone/menaquinone biosynthesis C-methylase UbiE
MNKTLPTYEELSQPLVPLSLSWFKWRATAMLLNTVGQLSDGIALGLKNGFDSGVMLDYVYENHARGKAIVGQWMDQMYLNTPGWRGIRQRKVHLKSILKEVIEIKAKDHQETIVMDIAAGPGQYLIETIQENPNAKLHILCRDLNKNGLAMGQKKAKGLQLSNITYEQADAFNVQDLKYAKPKPNAVIVSGLYELFTDDEIIKKSIRNIASILKKGDHYIVTNQPFHPQLEMIARVLPNRLGKPWVMRLRSDTQIRLWAEDNGFHCLKTLVDSDGIFSVFLFERK